MSRERFEDKIALVTGGAAGMGGACVTQLAREGATVNFFDLDDEAARALESELRAQGLPVFASLVDVADEAAFADAFERMMAETGRLDVLIQIAGASRGGTLRTQSLADWDWHLKVNLRSTVLGCKLAIEPMTKQGGGAIVNMSSISGLRGDPGWAAYNATKAAIVNFTQSVAWEVGRHNVRVNAVSPGPVASDRMIASLAEADDMVGRYRDACALARMAMPEEVASAILFLASDDASAITGHALVVDCGLTARTGQPISEEIFGGDQL